jgi:hypothetical protein
MLSARISLVAAGMLLVFTSCAAAPPMERTLVGTWVSCEYGLGESPPKPGEPIAKFVYKPDHTYVASISGKSATVTGKWRIEGDYLVERVDRSSKEERTFILQLTANKLVFTGVSGTKGHWWRLGTF